MKPDSPSETQVNRQEWLFVFPLVFLFIAAGIGLFLRWQFISPTDGLRYTYFLHGHSHVMFLGWVFNVLFLAFSESYRTTPNIRLFVTLQVLVVAMMISFPIQGYGVYSIVFSTLHTVVAFVFIVVFFRNTTSDRRISTWFARIALIFFAISIAGPFSLGYLMASKTGSTIWYNFSIYYYLHFQYNGFFMFGIFSLFFRLLERNNIPFFREKALIFGRWSAVACIPAYFLSILFARPRGVFNVAGAIAACIQILAIIAFLPDLRSIWSRIKPRLTPITRVCFYIVIASFGLKLLLQLLSSHADVAALAYSLRPVVIAYLHLVLVGIITVFLIAWYVNRNLIRPQAATIAISFLLIGFIGSQLVLVISPWWTSIVGSVTSSSEVVFGFSCLMFAGTAILLLGFRARNSLISDKSHSLI